jgi:hypothetical protein
LDKFGGGGAGAGGGVTHHFGAEADIGRRVEYDVNPFVS